MVKSLYLKFREEKFFLRVLLVFVVTQLSLHFWLGYDADWGGTNLTLSIEAAVASAVIMMEQKRASVEQQKQMDALIEMAAAEREMMLAHYELLKALKAQDEILLSLVEKK